MPVDEKGEKTLLLYLKQTKRVVLLVYIEIAHIGKLYSINPYIGLLRSERVIRNSFILYFSASEFTYGSCLTLGKG
jgi:hypothetical protein